MDSVDKLRERIDHLQDNRLLVPSECKVLRRYVDEVEREISELYTLNPVDADGIPIRVGDLLKEPPGTDYGIVEVVELHFDGEDWYFKGEVPMSFMGLAGYFNTAGWTHYHKPTVEDVLREFISDECVYTNETFAKYAEKLREVLADE